MSKKTRYSILSALVMIAIYSYNHYSQEKADDVIISSGKEVKSDTNEYFLPTSTTGQIVHHNGYSLSYSEPHEQAEWVAYELKKSHLSNTNYVLQATENIVNLLTMKRF